MWAHYADSHQGFLLEFDPSSQFFDQRRGPEDEFCHLRRVIYSDVRPTIVLTEIEDFSPFLTKGNEWSYEVEWRMMTPLEQAIHIIGDGPSAVHLFGFPKSAIRGVIMGCRMSDAKQNEIRQLLAAPEYRSVYCVQAEVDEQHYRLRLPSAASEKSASVS